MLLCVGLSDRSDWNIGPGYPDPWPQASKLRISCLAQGAQRCSQPQRQLQVKTDQNGDEAANGTLSPEALLQACVLAGNPQPRRPTPHVQAQISFKHRSTSFCVFWFGVRRPGYARPPAVCIRSRGHASTSADHAGSLPQLLEAATAGQKLGPAGTMAAAALSPLP